MFTGEYLSLRLVRLESREERVERGEGLSFVFPKRGAGRYLGGGVIQSLAPGDVLVLNLASRGPVSVAAYREMVFWCFCVSFEHLFPLFAANEICLLPSITESFQSCKWYPAAGDLAVQCHKLLKEIPREFDLSHRVQLIKLVSIILGAEFQRAHRQQVGFNPEQEHMARVFARLSLVEILSSSVGELAGKFGCGRRHLNRLFHQYFGFSVGALRMEMRLLRAVSLLRDADAKVINVAAQCGFNHLGLFNTCFKKRFGVSPGRWRKQVAQGRIPPLPSPGDDVACPLQGKGLCPLFAGTSASSVPLAPKVSAPEKSAGAISLAGKEAGEQVITHAVPLTYPKASNSMPLTA